MTLTKIFGVLILAAMAIIMVMIANKKVFEGKGVVVALLSYLVMTIALWGYAVLIWISIRMIVL